MGLEVLVLLVLLVVMGALSAVLWVVTIRHNRRSLMEGLLPLAGPWEAAFMTLTIAFLLLAVWGLLT